MLRIRLFGRFSVECHGEVLPGFESTKARELLGYLLCHRNRPHTREALADLFWGSSAGAQSRKYLRQILWQLQAVFSSPTTSLLPSLLEIDSEWVRINANDGLWLDVACFEEIFRQCRNLSGGELNSQQARDLREAVEIYRGDLLEGCYQDWCLYERERLHGLYQIMLGKLMSHCEASQEYETGIMIGGRMLCDDHASEQTHRRLMRLHYLAGDRSTALRQYERCVEALRKELRVTPSKTTVLLYEQIRADSLGATESGAGNDRGSAPENSNTAFPQVLNHLKEIQIRIVEIQRQVQEEIQFVEDRIER